MKKAIFKNLLRENKDRVFGYAFYYLKNKEDAEDVSQEVFIKLWNNWESVDKKRVVGWIMRVTHNYCIDMIRHKKASVSHQRMSAQIDMDRVLQNSDIQANPEAQYALSETQRMLLAAIDDLPAKTKSMLLLHYFQGLKFEEISDALGINLNTVKVTIHRGRKALKQILKKNHSPNIGTYRNEYAM